MKAKIREAIDKTRKEAGLPFFDKPLKPAVCEKCGRQYFWRSIPEICPWLLCGGKVKEV